MNLFVDVCQTSNVQNKQKPSFTEFDSLDVDWFFCILYKGKREKFGVKVNQGVSRRWESVLVKMIKTKAFFDTMFLNAPITKCLIITIWDGRKRMLETGY